MSPARDEQLVLAVDLGTGGPKVGFVSFTGRVAWQDHMPVDTTWLDHDAAVQDAERWWSLIVDATHRALDSGEVDPTRVAAVSITGQWASTVPVDEAGRPTGDCIMWMDKRGGRHVGPIIGGRVAGYSAKAVAIWLRRTGAAPSPQGGDPIGHMLLMERDLPEVARATRWYLEPVDYLSMRFTGRAAASPASITAYWLLDNRKLDVLAYDQDLVRLSCVPPEKLPPLQPTGSVIGPVLDSVAAELGLPGGGAVQVVTGTPDLHSATYGAGAVHDYEANMAISTTSWITAPVPFKKTDPIHAIASIPGAPPGKYLIVNNQDAAGRCFQWLRDTLGDGLGYDELTALAATSVPGSHKVLFTPWLNGERSPIDDRKARGGFHNLSLATTKADMVRAVLEGVALNSRWLLQFTERFAKRRLDDIRLIGGGAASDGWAQILADVLDRRIERVHEPLHAGIRGAAIYAGVVLGAVATDEIRSLVTVDRVFTPDPATRAVYDELFEELPRLYKAQKPMFAKLNGRPRRA